MFSPAYDAGTEENDELCTSIPGPACGGTGLEASGNGEGFIHVHRGFFGIGDLEQAEYDWRNPVMAASFKRIGVRSSLSKSSRTAKSGGQK